MAATRTATIAMGLLWLCGLTLLLFRPGLGLLCLSASTLIALALWLVRRGREIAGG